MLQELLRKLTNGEVKYCFENKPYQDPGKPHQLHDWLLWFTDSDLYIYLNERSDNPEYFAGMMTAACLLWTMAYRNSRIDDLKSLIDEVTWEFAHNQVYCDHDYDCIVESSNKIDSEGMDLIRKKATKVSMPFHDGFWDVLQVIYSSECLKRQDIDFEEGELLEEKEEDWPELIG